MSNFVGKWVDDKEKSKPGLEKMMSGIEGLSEEDKKMWMESVNRVEYKKDGDTWVCKQKSSAMPTKDKEVRFKSGVEFEDTDIDDSKYIATVTVVNDSTITEIGENKEYGTFDITRTVKGNEMEVSTKMFGTVSTTYMIKE